MVTQAVWQPTLPMWFAAGLADAEQDMPPNVPWNPEIPNLKACQRAYESGYAAGFPEAVRAEPADEMPERCRKSLSLDREEHHKLTGQYVGARWKTPLQRAIRAELIRKPEQSNKDVAKAVGNNGKPCGVSTVRLLRYALEREGLIPAHRPVC